MAGSFTLAPTTLLQPPEAPLSAAALLSIFDRVLDPSYLLPLKSPGPGYEVLQAFAAMWARVSQAAVNGLNVFTLSAQGGQLAQGFVAITRANANLGAETLKAGTLVTTSKGNRAFLTVDDAVFGATDLTAHDALTGEQSIPVVAVAMDWQWNVPGQVNAADGEAMAGDVDTVLLPIVRDANGNINFDPAIQVSNPVPVVGGRPAVLDQLAADMGLTRQQAESDVALSLRMRAVPAAITPAAISAVVAGILGPFGFTATIQEALGVGVLPSPTGYSGILVGFCDVDPGPPPAPAGTPAGTILGTQLPTAIGLWYFDQGLGPGLNAPVTPGQTASVGSLGPSDESVSTSRAFFRVHIPWIGMVNPGVAFAFLGSTGVGSPTPGLGTDKVYPTQGSFAGGAVPAGDYPWPSSGFFADSPATPTSGSFDGAGAATPTSVVAGQIFDALAQPSSPGGGLVAAGVGFEITVG